MDISAVDKPKFMGRPNYFVLSLKDIYIYFFKLLIQNWHVFHLIMFPLIESWVAHRATSRVMLDRPTAFGDWATAYPQRWDMDIFS